MQLLEHPQDVGGRFFLLLLLWVCFPIFFADGALGDLELHTQKVLEDKNIDRLSLLSSPIVGAGKMAGNILGLRGISC